MDTLGSFLLPEGFTRPSHAVVLRETSLVTEAGRYAARQVGDRRRARAAPYAGRSTARDRGPVVLVPGFLAGDATLTLMAARLRRAGFRTYRSRIAANVGCTRTATAQLEQRLQAIVARREQKAWIVGHSLGGMLARGLATRRPDLVAGIVTMGSPVLAPAAHHSALTVSVEALTRLTRAGLPGLMSEDCVAGECARTSFAECRSPLGPGVAFTAVYSRRDGIVDWQACADPLATPVEVTASHLGMAVDPTVMDVVTRALGATVETGPRRPAPGSALEVDRSVGA